MSDFGRITSFDMTLVRIDADDGTTGWGEAKAAVGSSGACAALTTVINHEIAPLLIGQPVGMVQRHWDAVYNGSRAGYAVSSGRAHPVLGRRGLLISALSGVDMALWDLHARQLGCGLIDLFGGPVTDRMPAYASGGWAPAESIGDELGRYVSAGFGSVKMRVGAMDGSVAASARRVLAAREALGPNIGLMVDAHGTFSPPDAIRFMHLVIDADLRWFEEPVSADDRAGATRVRAAATMPIAAGESEFTRFDFADLIARDAVDVLQPDLAICGGVSEARRIAALAETHQLELAPHCWGSALSFHAALHVAFASSAARIIEYSLGANPFLRELPVEQITPNPDATFGVPTGDGLGVTPNTAFVEQYRREVR